MPAYLYWGEEEFNLDCAVKDLRSRVLDSNFAGINHKILNDPDIKQLIETLQTLPMMLGNLLVEVRTGSLFLRGKREIPSDDPLMQKLMSLIERLDNRVHLLFICKIERDSNKKIDSTIKLTKTIKKFGEVREFPAFKFYQEDKIAGWIIQQASQKSLKISKEAALCLVRSIGSDLRKLDTELDRIQTAIHPKTSVSINEVKEISATNENIFLLADLLLVQNRIQAIKELYKLLEQHHPLKMLATLHTITRRWLKIKQKLPVNMPPFLVEQDDRKLRDIPLERLLALKERVKNTEFKIKSGELPPETAMELLCLRGY